MPIMRHSHREIEAGSSSLCSSGAHYTLCKFDYSGFALVERHRWTVRTLQGMCIEPSEAELWDKLEQRIA
jgi:hypothetical protein